MPNIGGVEPKDKQDTLVSGENIKTINGKSILGEGDINTNEAFFELLRGNKLSFYCVENVDVIINGESHSSVKYRKILFYMFFEVHRTH